MKTLHWEWIYFDHLGMIIYTDMIKYITYKLKRSCQTNNRQIFYSNSAFQQRKVLMLNTAFFWYSAYYFVWQDPLGESHFYAYMPIKDMERREVAVLTNADFFKLEPHWEVICAESENMNDL